MLNYKLPLLYIKLYLIVVAGGSVTPTATNASLNVKVLEVPLSLILIIKVLPFEAVPLGAFIVKSAAKAVT